MSTSQEVQRLYETLIDAWNRRDAEGMAALFGEEGVQIGFDGSIATGREEILSHLAPIFESGPTASYVGKVKDIRFLGNNVALLRAVAEMAASGEADAGKDANAHQTVIAVKDGGRWSIELFQNTPATELSEAVTEGLRQLLLDKMRQPG